MPFCFRVLVRDAFLLLVFGGLNKGDVDNHSLFE